MVNKISISYLQVDKFSSDDIFERTKVSLINNFSKQLIRNSVQGIYRIDFKLKPQKCHKINNCI